MPFITIFTPVFNRAHTLSRTYQSILEQSSEDFEWLIVDDGSTDNTESLVQNWINTNTAFPIRYIKKNNGGKHTTINLGVKEAKGEFFVIIDSDDWFAPNALNILSNKLKDIQPTSLGGILGLTRFENGQTIGNKFPELKEKVTDFAQLYYKYGVKGDKSVAFRTACLREFPFPEPEGIKFVSELVVWHPLTEKYGVHCINEHIEVKEYQAAGLSDSSYKMWYWESLAYTYFYLIQNNIHSWNKYFKTRNEEYLILIINSLLADKSYFNKLPGIIDKFAYIANYPRAFYSYLNIKKYVQKNIK